MTLLQSIAMAGGLKEWANRKDVRVLRSLSGSIERYDLRDIEKQKIPDVRLQPGDIITEVNHRSVTTPKQFREAVKTADAKKGIVINFTSHGTSKFEILKESSE